MVICYTYQDGIKFRKEDVSPNFPRELQNRDGFKLFQIVNDGGEGLKEVLSDFPILDQEWYGFTTSDNKIANKYKLSLYYKWLLRGVGPCGISANELYYFEGGLIEVIDKVTNDILWGVGGSVILPVINRSNEELSLAVKAQLNRNMLKVINVFGCMILTNYDGDGLTFVWEKEWIHSDMLTTWAQSFTKRVGQIMGDNIKLNDKDVAILYCIPRVPCELINIIRNYTFINRDAPPSFDELTSFISKSLRAGIISESCGIYTVDEDWYRKIHFYDDRTKNEIDSMLLFEEAIVGIELPVVSDSVKLFSRENYGMSVGKINEDFRESYRRIKGL